MTDRIGKQLGNYLLLRVLGKGGFATVFLGEHVHLGTPAALKVLQAQLAQDEQEHFLEEARTVARLSHPNIIRVLDFGIEQDIPFLVMEYAPGGSLRQRYPRGEQLSAQEALPFLKQAAAALQYAHDQQVIYRDVKPENMLLGEHDEVLLGDFGIALIAQSMRLSGSQEVVGTVTYMAPEQIQGNPHPASDQYSLGIVLYEWLCGTVPFQGSFTEVCSQHLFTPLPPLHEKLPTISPAIEAVVDKALAKDFQERFPSVQQMALAFEEACQGEESTPSEVPPTIRRSALTAPTVYAKGAQPLPATQRAILPPDGFAIPKLPDVPASHKGMQPRLPRRAVMLGLGAAGLVAAGGGLLVFLIARQNAAPSRSPAIFTAPSSPTASAPPHPPGTTLIDYKKHTGDVYAVSWSPNGQYIASGSADTTVQVWNTSTGDTLSTYRGHAGLLNGVFSVDWSPHGQWVASAGADKTVQIWDAGTTNRVTLYQAHTARVLAAAWSPDGASIASGGADKTVQIWDAFSGSLMQNYQGHTDTVYAVTWSPDGKNIASGSADRTIQIWDAASGRRLLLYQKHAAAVYALAWSPDGKYLASAGADRTVQIWEVLTGKQIYIYHEHSGLLSTISTVAWSPDGKDLASGSTDKTVHIWEALTGKEIYTYQKHTGTVYTVKWAANGQYISSGSADTTVKIWRTT